MKVCFLTGEYPPMQGGVADHTAHLARHLIEQGIEACVLTSRKADPNLQLPPARWREPACPCGTGPGGQAISNLQSPISNPQSPVVYPIITGWGWRCWRQIGHFLTEQRPDVLHIQYQAAAFDLGGWVNWLPWWLRRRRDRPHIAVTFHDLRVPYLFPKAGPLRWRSILALARYADGVIATNVEDEQILLKYQISNTKSQISRIPLGSNVEPCPPADYDRGRWRARLGLEDSALLLAYFGFLNESKGGEDLVLALDRLVQQGYNAHLVMIGGQVGDVDPTNAAYADRIRSLVQVRGLAERVQWTGYTSPGEVSAHLLAADAVVMPYRDGASFRRTTFIAALRHGCPIITTHPAVPLAELRDGDNVLLVAPRDPQAMARAAARLADDPVLRARLSAGAGALGQTFDWPTVARQTATVYQQL
jgi:glycosyltransferase involved in cell wall biosynthesis